MIGLELNSKDHLRSAILAGKYGQTKYPRNEVADESSKAAGYGTQTANAKQFYIKAN